MLSSNAFANLDKEIKDDYKDMILNQGSHFANKVDLNAIFADGKLTLEAKETLENAMVFSFNKSKPVLLKYFDSLTKRADDFMEKYTPSYHVPEKLRDQDQVKFENWDTRY